MDQIRDSSAYPKYREVLRKPRIFWLALAAKLLPWLWRSPIRLRLKRGGEFDVEQFMTLYIFKEVFVDGCYDRPTLPLAAPNIIDVGANTGLFTLRMKQLYPHATIMCYEPMPDNFRQLQRTIRLSALTDCTPLRQGIGGNARQTRLFVHQRNVGGHSLHADLAGSSKSVDIDLVDLKAALARLDGEPCHLLKLDCEGAENEILRSVDAETARSVQRIIFEPTPSLYRIDDLRVHLERIGYRMSWNQGTYIALHKSLDEATPCA